MPKILVLYYSRTGNTEKMAKEVAEGAKETGNIQVDLNYFVQAEDLDDFDAIISGTPTYHHDLPIDIKMLFEEAAARNVTLRGKTGAAFGSYGWSGEAPKFVLEIMKNKFEMKVFEAPLLAKYVPRSESVRSVQSFGGRLAENLIRKSTVPKGRILIMSNPDEKLIGFMKKQISNENNIVKSITEGIKNIKNPPVKAILKGISLDSTKHAELYASAVTLLTTVSQAMTQENLGRTGKPD